MCGLGLMYSLLSIDLQIKELYALPIKCVKYMNASSLVVGIGSLYMPTTGIDSVLSQFKIL